MFNRVVYVKYSKNAAYLYRVSSPLIGTMYFDVVRYGWFLISRCCVEPDGIRFRLVVSADFFARGPRTFFTDNQTFVRGYDMYKIVTMEHVTKQLGKPYDA